LEEINFPENKKTFFLQYRKLFCKCVWIENRFFTKMISLTRETIAIAGSFILSWQLAAKHQIDTHSPLPFPPGRMGRRKDKRVNSCVGIKTV